MNRAERRRREREEKKKISVGQAKAMQKDVAKGIIFETVETYNAALALVLRDKHKFGKGRLEKFYNNMSETVADIVHGYLSVEDIQETIKDETGYDLKS